MIHYTLQCADGHRFEGWFRSSRDYEAQAARGAVSCTVCGSTEVRRAPMAPAVSRGRAPSEEAAAAPAERPEERLRALLRKLRRKVEEEADYVGDAFAEEARRIHAGEAEDRPIWGEARPEEARALIEEGVPVAPLPFVPTRKLS